MDHLQWLFTATLLIMLSIVLLFGATSVRYPRHRLLRGAYLFFIIKIDFVINGYFILPITYVCPVELVF